MFSRGDERAQNVRQPTDCCRRANVTANTSLISYLTHWERLVHTNKDTWWKINSLTNDETRGWGSKRGVVTNSNNVMI